MIGKRSPKALRSTLTTLPTGTEAYSQAYEGAMERIESQVDDQTELAWQVLCWITCARRPLTTLEIQHALAVERGASDIDKDNISQIEDIISVCAGLVTVDDESKVIRLVHYTAQQYFEHNQRKLFPAAEVGITAVCLTYLSFSVFETGPCQTVTEFDGRLDSYPFYDYAARNWGHHARESINNQQGRVYQNIIDFLKSTSKIHASSQVIIHPFHKQHFPTYITALLVAAYFDLQTPFYALLNSICPPDIEDHNGQTPLFWRQKLGIMIL